MFGCHVKASVDQILQVTSCAVIIEEDLGFSNLAFNVPGCRYLLHRILHADTSNIDPKIA